MSYRLCLSCTVLLTLTGCFNPDKDAKAGESDTDVGDTDATTTNDPSQDTVDPPTTGVSTMSDDTGAVCGDGVVEGDEVCDDGVNDGSYDSCLADCSARAGHCGDGEVNGPEVCDDGVNDGSYGGCASDCSADGPFCGDGIVQREQEMCDEGDDNENGSGCNVDCTVSGTVLAEWWSDGLGNCGDLPTNPVFRADDTVLVAASISCQGNELALFELSPDLEQVEVTEYFAPATPVSATMRDGDWIISTWNECNFIVPDGGDYDEVCETDRITGNRALVSRNDGMYLALDGSRAIGRFGASSPALNDTPDWSTTLPTTQGGATYYWLGATFGPSGSMIVGGEYNISGVGWTGHVRRFSAPGNQTGQQNFPDFEMMQMLRQAHDGNIVGKAWDKTSSADVLFKLQSNLQLDWVVPMPSLHDLRVESAGDIIVEYGGDPWHPKISRRTSEGEERWTLELEFQDYPNSGRLGIDANGTIVRSSVEWDPRIEAARIRVTKISP